MAPFPWIVLVVHVYTSYKLAHNYWVVRKCPEMRITVGGCNTTTG
jgi:hypothetical protein